MQPGNKLIGANGCLLIDAAVTEKKFYMLVVNEDCVLTTLTGSDGTNLLVEYGLTAKTLKQGLIITAKGEESIESVTPSSGDLMGYNE